MLDALAALPPWVPPAGLAALAVLAAALWWRRHRLQAGARATAALDTLLGWEPEATRVLSSSELRAYALLTQAMPQYLLLAQVPLARFIRVPTRHSYAEWLRRVGHLNADFVVCDTQAQVLAVIELRRARPRGGEREGRRQERFARVLKQAGIPLQVWTDGALPSVGEVRRSLQPAAQPAPLPVQVPKPRPEARPAAEPGYESTQYPADEVIEVREPPSSTWFDEYDSTAMPLDPARPRR